MNGGLGLIATTLVSTLIQASVALAQQVPPCGQELDSAVYRNAVAFSNGADQGTGNSCAGVGTYGYQFQCVEYVKRLYSLGLGIDTTKWTGNAVTYFDTAANKLLGAVSNGGSNPPALEDILVFSGGTYGHVAVVTSVTQDQVTVIEQNWSPSGTTAVNLTTTNGTYTVGPRGRYSVVGWLRTMDDNFNADALNLGRWAVLQPPPGLSGTTLETNQRLEISLGPGFGGTGIVSVCRFPGDFDVQVDYTLLTWPTTNLHSARLGAPDLGVGPGGGIGLNRSSFSNGGTGEFYLISLSNVDPQIPAGQLFGKLRLVRSGSTMSGFIMDGTGSWTLVGSGPVSTAATRISLDLGAGSASAQGGVSAAFDNFKVNAGTISCLQ